MYNCIRLFTIAILIFHLNSYKVYGSEYKINAICNDCSVLVKDDKNKTVYSYHETDHLIPASTLKVLTSLVAFHYLGKDFRFKTEFYLDSENNLKIKGYGDPFLVSEIISEFTPTLCAKIRNHAKTINNIVLDNSHFDAISIPGVTSGSSEPYDAPSGALCVNFNTVHFKQNSEGSYESAEEQTPLLPFTLQHIEQSGLKEGRIILNEQASRLYPGYIFNYFLNKNGITVQGNIRNGKYKKTGDKLIYTHYSRFTVESLVGKLMEFSNNFIANQLFIASGIKAHGAPGTLDKGVKTAKTYARTHLKITSLKIEEGSGLSRNNSITADDMDVILKAFQPYKHLMRKRNHEWYKTGTLSGISTRVGYISDKNNKLFRFTVFCNTQGKSSESLVNTIKKSIFVSSE